MAKDVGGHGSDSRGGSLGSQDARRKAGNTRGMPIPGHPYHTKTNDELRYIAKDASAAAQAMQSHGSFTQAGGAEGKYLDQVNDASTVLGWRQRGGADLSQSPAVDVAAQHGMDTSHLSDPPSRGPRYIGEGGPNDHGGPRIRGGR